MIIGGLVVAGGVGAVLRYLVDHLVKRMTGSGAPVGILVVNVTGSLVLGFLTGAALHHGVSALWLTVIGTGLIGSYTTFSSFTLDTVSLAERDQWALSVVNLVVSLGLGVGAAALGLALGSLA